MSFVQVTLHDATVHHFEKGVTLGHVAAHVYPNGRSSEGKTIVAATCNGIPVELSTPLEADATIQFIDAFSTEGLERIRHTAAHILAQALRRIYGTQQVKLGIGPVIEDGFYYDVDVATPISTEDFAEIETEMQRIIASDYPLVRRCVTREEALARFATVNDHLKRELIADIPADMPLTIYEQGEFFDLCRGLHVPSTGHVKAFKLLSVAGAYWRGDVKKPMLQRIYGTAFATTAQLHEHLAFLEEAKKRDHRKLGKELKLFAFASEVGQGLPLWLPRGAKLRRIMERYIIDLEEKLGYDHVYTPVLGSVELYKISGHWEHYQENMFPQMPMDNESLILRPMNCPHHMMVYKSEMRSYRDLPVRIAEMGTMHRYELSGSLTGLHRVRAMTLNDGHIFCRADQIKTEFQRVIALIERVYADFGITQYRYRLSYRDPQNTEKYFPDDEMWETSQRMLKEVVEELGLEYYEAIGEAAFYGPKVDVQIVTALRKEETLSTAQLDFLLPQRFELEYVASDGTKQRPVVIHRSVISTMERMMAFLLENFAGALPAWLCPVQVIVIPVSDKFLDYAEAVTQRCLQQQLRAETEVRNEKLGYKIREAQGQRIPYMFVVGAAEQEAQTVSVRQRGVGDQGTMTIDDAVAHIRVVLGEKGNLN